MGWLRRLFGGNKRERGGPLTSQFHESETTSSEEETSRNAPRRELIQVIMRDTMRKHGIPSDWIECRILSTVSRSGRAGLHVNFVVRQAHDQLLGYVFAFQASFESELARFESRARDWLLGIGWEFEGQKLTAPMPDPNSWKPAALPAQTPLARPGAATPLVDAAGLAAAKEMEVELPKSDEGIQRDLEALFAIRDAAIADTSPRRSPLPAVDTPDFAPTQPSEYPLPDPKP